MTAMQRIYQWFHPGAKRFPCWTSYSLWRTFWKPLRKWVNVVVAPNCPFTKLRVFLYRACGYKIGRDVFIGMRCYLDDLCYDCLEIEDDVTISYGVYFASHGKGQGHNRIIIREGAYVGMRASIITPNGDVEIGEKAIVGACALVNKSIPAGKTAVGIPVRILGE